MRFGRRAPRKPLKGVKNVVWAVEIVEFGVVIAGMARCLNVINAH